MTYKAIAFGLVRRRTLNRSFKNIVLAGLGLFALYCGYLVKRDLIGAETGGVVLAAQELPMFKEEEAILAGQGPLSYHLYKAGQRFTYLVSGATTDEKVRNFCDRFRLYGFGDPRALATDPKANLLECRGDITTIKIDYVPHQDFWMYGADVRLHKINLYFSPTTGTYTLSTTN